MNGNIRGYLQTIECKDSSCSKGKLENNMCIIEGKKIESLLKKVPGVNNNKGLINLEMDYQTKMMIAAIIFLVIYFMFIKEKDR